MRKIIAAATVTLLLASCSPYRAKNIEKAVADQMEQYPESTLVDLYKFFYQDIYGSGHMIADVQQAAIMLDDECYQQWEVPYGGIIYERTGVEGNYYRVTLYCTNSGMVSPEVMVDAFVRSAKENTPADAAKLRKVWPKVARAASCYDIPGYEEDLNELNALVASDSPDKAVHHSDAYNKAYDPHYRLISKDIFINEIYPRLDL